MRLRHQRRFAYYTCLIGLQILQLHLFFLDIYLGHFISGNSGFFRAHRENIVLVKGKLFINAVIPDDCFGIRRINRFADLHFLFSCFQIDNFQVRVGKGNPHRAGLLVALLAFIFSSPVAKTALPPAPVAPVAKIGELLMGSYIVPLQVVGVLLTAALIGAAVLAMEDKQP